MITEEERGQLKEAVKSIVDISEASLRLGEVLESQGWKWRTGEWGYAENHWTTLVRKKSRASVQFTNKLREIKIEVRDLRGDNLEQSIVFGEWEPLFSEEDEDELDDF